MEPAELFCNRIQQRFMNDARTLVKMVDIIGVGQKRCHLDKNIERKEFSMKDKIHPKYEKVTVHCVCGNTFESKSTSAKLEVQICEKCHPFYTGKQRSIQKAGRVERFNKKYNVEEQANEG